MKILKVQNVSVIQNTNQKQFDKMLFCLKRLGSFDLGDAILLHPTEWKYSKQKYYIVKPCDSIDDICQKFDVSKEWIFAKNNCKNVFAGQKIVVGEL